jgi:hypothetical protein
MMVVMMMLMIVEMVIVMFGGFGLLRQTETQTTPDFSRFWPGCSWSVEPELLVLRERIELSASPLPRECSTTELPQLARAGFDFPERGRMSHRPGSEARGGPEIRRRQAIVDGCSKLMAFQRA